MMATNPLNPDALEAARAFGADLPETADPLADLQSDSLDEENSLEAPEAGLLSNLPHDQQVWRETCPKCRGTGLFAGFTNRADTQCFRCQGRGYNEYKTSPEQRAARAKPTADSRARYQDRKEREQARQRERAELAVAEWCRMNPAEGAWLQAQLARTDGGSSNFAAACRDGIVRFGRPTDNMVAAIRRAIERDAQEAEERAARRLVEEARSEPVNDVNLEAVEQAFARAKQQGIKHPKLTLEGFTLNPAPEHGKNPGAIYVKAQPQGAYLGRVLRGEFTPVRECTDETKARVLQALADPMASAVAFGKKFGRCAICFRELSDPDSIERGIGPKCAERYGWGS